ncbi:MAG: hypothetical protein PHS86_07925 [Syntrophaceae bacterium]|nr:hypothetical protein [Syntrophaceae bacterium]
MTAIQDIYETKNYRNKIPVSQAVTFEVGVRDTNIHVQAQSDLMPKAKESVFRYRYQIEEYLRQHPAFRDTQSPIQIYSSAPEIVKYCDLACRNTGVAPMACMSGAMADFVGRDLMQQSPVLVVSSGGDTFVRSTIPLEVQIYAKGSPLHEKLKLQLPATKNIFGISTYVPGKGIQAVTVLSRTASWASSFAKDLGVRLDSGESLKSTLNRAEAYSDVGAVIIISGSQVVFGGSLNVKCLNGAGS